MHADEARDREAPVCMFTHATTTSRNHNRFSRNHNRFSIAESQGQICNHASAPVCVRPPQRTTAYHHLHRRPAPTRPANQIKSHTFRRARGFARPGDAEISIPSPRARCADRGVGAGSPCRPRLE